MNSGPHQTPRVRAYAKAVLTLGNRQQTLDHWERFLYAASLALKHPRLRRRLQNPKLRAPEEMLASVCAPVLFDAAHHLLRLLAKRKSLQSLPAIADRFSQLRQQQAHQLKVKIASAIPLSQADMTQLEQHLAKQFQRKILLDASLDATLLGGLLIRVGDQVLDFSLRGRLNRLRASLS